MKELAPAERRALRALAHRLDPVVLIGAGGLTAAVLAEIEVALKAHELIKVRIAGDRDDREKMQLQICARTGAAPVQHIGRILVLYLKRPPKDADADRPGRPVRTADKRGPDRTAGRARTPPPRRAATAPRRGPGRTARLSEAAAPRRGAARKPSRYS